MKTLLSLATLIFLFLPLGTEQDKTLPVLDSGDGVILHFWLPAEAVGKDIPSGFSPAVFALDPQASLVPGGKVDALIFLRSCNWKLNISGSRVSEDDILEAFLAIPVRQTEKPEEKDHLQLLVLKHYSDSKLLDLAIPQFSLGSLPLQGKLSLSANAAGGLRLRTSVKADNFSPWEIGAQTTEETRFSCPWKKTTLHFPGTDGVKSISLSTEKNSWFRAKSTVSGFRDSNPVNQFGEWRWADSNTYLIVFEDNNYSAK